MDEHGVTSLFDAALDAEDFAGLDRLLEEGGLHAVMALSDAIKYPRKEDVTKLAVGRYLTRHVEKAAQTRIEYAYGCRRPDTEPGTSDGVFIVAKEADTGNITSAIFENGVDYIGHPDSDEHAREHYDAHVASGHVKMTVEDVSKVSGIAVASIPVWSPPSLATA